MGLADRHYMTPVAKQPPPDPQDRVVGLPPITQQDFKVDLDTYCWRCERQGVELVKDPLVPLTFDDKIGVCKQCAKPRNRIREFYYKVFKLLKKGGPPPPINPNENTPYI